jgi:hypothetical protein
MNNILLSFTLFIYFTSSAQYTGAKPYISQFGPNQSVYNSGANFEVTNTDEYDMVIAIVNLKDKVIAHAYIKASETFLFKNLPVDTYYYKFENNGSFYEDKELMRFEGCDPKVYICEGGPEKAMNLWVERTTGYVSSKISKKSFFNN